ncbi:hypothetical protein [Haliea sp.]|jgi:hypothetical protein|uniref:hypothetical protein n=1 Tax=Haliea sp. TaxID=1932666 RepID=UPI000C37F208|nr:hypothetical protein [Haliea sp.]MAD65705.1 hypothetical protein [Haliea sp.]|tara:strand:+ start:38397 stop:39176 length:780 start_codon:yes stop_codon:yes gene_type:complete
MSFIKEVSQEAKKNPKKRLMLIGSFVLFVAVIGYRLMGNADMSASDDSGVSPSSKAVSSQAEADLNQEQSVQSNREGKPESVEMFKSVESMAGDYVAGALDSNEALAFLVKQESKRILALDESISEYRKKISSNAFQAALEKGKLENIEDYIQADVGNLKGERSDDKPRYTDNNGPYYQQQEGSSDNEEKEESGSSIEDFKLHSIFQYDGEWIARVSKSSGVPENIRQGQKLGEVEVVKVTDSMVSLSDGAKQRDLYIF